MGDRKKDLGILLAAMTVLMAALGWFCKDLISGMREENKAQWQLFSKYRDDLTVKYSFLVEGAIKRMETYTEKDARLRERVSTLEEFKRNQDKKR